MFCLLRFISGYSFCCMVNRIVSYICLSDLLLLAYRNARDICILILYLAKLPNPLISSSGFPVASFGFFLYNIMSSTNTDSFTSFPSWVPFIYFSLIAVASTSKTMLNNSGESGYPCFVPNLRGNSFLFFLPLRMLFAMNLSHMAFIMLT